MENLDNPINERYPAVLHLSIHLENGQRVYFTSKNLVDKLNKRPQTTFLAFIELWKIDEFAKTLIYCEIPWYYIWDNNKFTRRKQRLNVSGWPGVKKDNALGRVYDVHPNYGECYCLRLLLHEVRGPTSFSDLKTVIGVLHSTLQSACKTLGLLEDDINWHNVLKETALSETSVILRGLFSLM